MDAAHSGQQSRKAFQAVDCRVEITGDLVQFRVSLPHPPIVLRKKRREVSSFSPASRRRMLRLVSSVDWRNIKRGLFVTLTFPDQVLPMLAYRRNQARHQFLRSLETYVGQPVGALWRIEWKERLSGRYKGNLCPHFHLIIPGIQFIPYQKISLWWKQAIGWTGHVNTDVARLTNKRHHAVYIAKYAAKVPEASNIYSVSYLNMDGRHWGVHRPTLIPRYETVTYDGLSERAVQRLQQIGRDTFYWYGEYAELGFSMFGSLGANMIQAVHEICLDKGEAFP